MKFGVRITLLAVLLVALSGIASAGTITFDEFPATNNNVALTNAYAGIGVIFDNRNSGIWCGLSCGDPGNWGVTGTNGPNFLGDNGVNNGGSYTESIFFTTPESSISFDASRTNGSAPGQTLTVDAYDASNTLVGTEQMTLGGINTWSTFNVTGAGITSVVLMGSNNGFSPYGIGNLQFNPVPEPGSTVLLGTGLVWLVGIIIRRKLNLA